MLKVALIYALVIQQGIDVIPSYQRHLLQSPFSLTSLVEICIAWVYHQVLVGAYGTHRAPQRSQDSM